MTKDYAAIQWIELRVFYIKSNKYAMTRSCSNQYENSKNSALKTQTGNNLNYK